MDDYLYLKIKGLFSSNGKLITLIREDVPIFMNVVKLKEILEF